MNKQQLEKKISRAVDRALEKAATLADQEINRGAQRFDPEEWLYLRPAVQRIAVGIRRMKSAGTSPEDVLGRLRWADQKDQPLGLSVEDVGELMRLIRGRPLAGPVILPPATVRGKIGRELKTVRAHMELSRHRAGKRAARAEAAKKSGRTPL